MKKAFTMIELIFVIVILGILSSVAISKMSVTRDDAQIAKGRSQISAIRNAITLMRNTNMLQGKGASYPAFLDDDHDTHDGLLFDGNDTIGKLLDYPIYDKASTGEDINGNWEKDEENQYHYTIMNTNVRFMYTPTNGHFDCDHGSGDATEKKLCKSLTE